MPQGADPGENEMTADFAILSNLITFVAFAAIGFGIYCGCTR
jgi:hypothetical protein